MDIRRSCRRVGVTLATSALLLTGISVTTAQAASDNYKPKKGSIEVCKKVDGSHKYNNTKFNFVIRDKDDDKDDGDYKEKFTLKDNKCEPFDLKYGKYRIVEKNLPYGCRVDDIVVNKGKDDKTVIKDDKGVVVVTLDKKNDKVKVTFKNKCKDRK